MSSSETQSENAAPATYFDPEAPDVSEQQFSASLEDGTAKPSFMVDAAEREPAPGEAAERRAGTPSIPHPPNPLTSTGGEQESTISAGPDNWRQQVSAKVSSYRSKRPRQQRYPSLQLQFDNNAPGPPPFRPDNDPVLKESEITFPAQQSHGPEPPLSLEATARVLEFPRPASLREELAEPMLDQPRIVEAPELLPPPPAMGGILIPAAREPEPERRPGFDVPLQSASLGRRLAAGTADALLVAAAVAGFCCIFVRIAGAGLPWRTIAESVAGLALLSWFTYQYAFLVFCGVTPGLRVARLEVRRFDGMAAPRQLRRWRVLSSALSATSLGLGYAWCFLDEDQLSWHDRITKTHLAPVSNSPR
ncbi:MAG TPA: RDD family protein [Terriglobales bacterium]|nr:RDD family protein [Terriglobales bacterium]